MRSAMLVALAAAIGNMLQGWDNSTIAGAVLYIKKEFDLQSEPTIEGLIVAMSIVGGTLITTFSGSVSDAFGRRPMLILSSVLYFCSGIVMLWSPNVYILLLARLLDGFGVGLAVTQVPVYISETSPPEVRGLLSTIPQLAGSTGMFLSYCMVFGMSLKESPSWRLMLGVLSIPSLFYFVFALLFLPESPRWLVSKGRMLEAKQVLQRLRGTEDVSVELALLVEGLAVGRETVVEEYIIGQGNEPFDDQIKLYGSEEGVSWIAKPISGQGTSVHESIVKQSSSLIDPIVTLFESVHEKLPEAGSLAFPNTASAYSASSHQVINEQWDEESQKNAGDNEYDVGSASDSDDNLHSPLLSRETTAVERDGVHPENSSIGSGKGIGGGWQLAWKLSGRINNGKKEVGVHKIYLHHEGNHGSSQRGSAFSVSGADIHEEGEFVQATALVSQSAISSKNLSGKYPIGPAMVSLPETAAAPQRTRWSDLSEVGVKRALIVGIGLQILQQLSGINGVLYYTPQILDQAGVSVLLSNLGVGRESASFLVSTLTTLMMLPCIVVAMRLMDISGRRTLMLATIPVLVVSLLLFVGGSIVNTGAVANAVVSTVSVMVYLSVFVMGFGAIPNILCSEIFPTRVRGICISICVLTYWFVNIIITYTLPVMLNRIGLSGLFTVYAVACVVSWIFIYLKVPETKGMPLEVISEFFAVGAKQAAEDGSGK